MSKKCVAHRNRCGLVGRIIIEIRNLDMRTKADHFVADLLFKANHNSHRKDHNSQSESNPNNGNANNRRGGLTVALLAEMYPFGNKQF